MKTIELEPSARIGRHKSRSAGVGEPKRAETVAVHLPKNVVLFLNDLCAAAGIQGGAAGLITHQLASLIREEPSSFCSGILMEILDLYELARERDSDNLHTAASRWKLDDKQIVVLDPSQSPDFKKATSPATPKSVRPLKLDVPENARPVIQRLIDHSGFYGSVAEALGMTSAPWRDACDLAALQIQAETDMRADGVAKLYGLLHIEKLRVAEFAEHPARASEREWLFGADADKEAVVA